MTTEQRLNNVEDDLDVVKKLLVSTARYAESANQGLDQLTERVDQLTRQVNQLTGQVDRLTQDLTASTQDLVGMISQLANDAAQDRATIRENQVEIRRIWEYLLRQSGNGSGG